MCMTVTARYGTGGGNVPIVISYGFKPRNGSAARSIGYEKELAPTLNSDSNSCEGGVLVMTYGLDHVICSGGNCTAQGPCYYYEVCPTLKAGGAHAVMTCKDTLVFDESQITSRQNGNHPTWGGGCATPSTETQTGRW